MKTTRSLNLTDNSASFSIDDVKDERISASIQLVAMIAEAAGIKQPYRLFKDKDGNKRYFIPADVVQKAYDAVFE